MCKKHLILTLQYILVFLKEARGCVILKNCPKVPCFCSGSLFKGNCEKSRTILLNLSFSFKYEYIGTYVAV